MVGRRTRHPLGCQRSGIVLASLEHATSDAVFESTVLSMAKVGGSVNREREIGSMDSG